jgi:hypothetical protein
VIPTVLVFSDVAALMESLQLPGSDDLLKDDQASPESGAAPTGSPTPDEVFTDEVITDEVITDEVITDEVITDEVITDEVRTRYGHLLDSAAERGLLDPADYEIRLGELAKATTTAQMVEIVAELPAFAPRLDGPVPPRSRRAIQSASRAGSAAEQRRRRIMWALMALLVIVALASLVILAFSVERLSRNHNSSPPPAPVATRPVSALRL